MKATRIIKICNYTLFSGIKNIMVKVEMLLEQKGDVNSGIF